MSDYETEDYDDEGFPDATVDGYTDLLGDPFDPEFEYNLADAIKEAVHAGVEEATAPIREYATQQQAEAAAEKVRENGLARTDEILAELGLDGLESKDVFLRADEIYAAMDDPSEAAAERAVRLAAQQLGEEQQAEAERAVPELNPVVAEAFGKARHDIRELGGDEVSLANKWTKIESDLNRIPAVRSTLQIPDPPMHAPAEQQNYFTRGKNDELELAHNFGRDTAT